MSQTETIMIIGAGQEHIIGQEVAKSLGLQTFVIDGNPNAPGLKTADYSAVVSTYDYEGALATAQDFEKKTGKISGVMTLASDVPYTVAYVAEHLDLPGIGTEAALNASEKLRMKECFECGNVPMPLFRGVADEKELAATAEKFEFSVVVKPVDSRGARGVQLIRTKAQLASAYSTARRYSPTGRVMVEQYLDGPQLSTEGFMLDGQAYTPAIFDRNYEYLRKSEPFIVENGGEMPSIYSQQYAGQIDNVIQQAALSLGIKTGVVKGDLVIHKGEVKVIELAARLSGGFFGTVATPVSCGVNLVEINIRLCMGRKVTPEQLEHKLEKAAAIRFSFPNAGRVKSITGLDKVLQEPACKYAYVFSRPGDLIEPITNHPGRPAVVVAQGNCLSEAVSNAKRMIEMLQWEIEGV